MLWPLRPTLARVPFLPRLEQHHTVIAVVLGAHLLRRPSAQAPFAMGRAVVQKSSNLCTILRSPPGGTPSRAHEWTSFLFQIFGGPAASARNSCILQNGKERRPSTDRNTFPEAPKSVPLVGDLRKTGPNLPYADGRGENKIANATYRRCCKLIIFVASFPHCLLLSVWKGFRLNAVRAIEGLFFRGAASPCCPFLHTGERAYRLEGPF